MQANTILGDLRVTLVQSSIVWENVQENLNHFSDVLHAIKADATDVIVLPEMFSTGFSMNSESLSELPDGLAFQWMKQMAKQKNAVLVGSIMTRDQDRYANRLVWMNPDGTSSTYDKKHLFRYANEQNHYQPGTSKLIVKYKGWKICLMVCYDLRFPVWSRRVHEQAGDYDVLVYVANWPERRRLAWKTLLAARAIENQAYVIGVNRVGADGKNITHSGDSVLLDPKGEVLSNIPEFQEKIETYSLSYSELMTWRNAFPAWMDADAFELK